MNNRPVLVFEAKGSWKKTADFLHKMLRRDTMSIFHKYGKIGVVNLMQATPKDTGTTSLSWDYKIVKDKDNYRLVWTNSNFSEGIPVAILIQYGHGTRGGTFVEGIDYINPALKSVFEDMAEELWKEVKNI